MPRAPAPSLFLFCSITVALIFTRHPPLSIRLSLSHLSNFDWTDFSPRPYTKTNRIVMRIVLVVPLSLIVFHDGVLRNGGSKLLHRREVFTHGASVLPMKSPENKQIKIIEKVDCVPSFSYEVGKSAPTLFHIYLADFGQLLTLNCSLSPRKSLQLCAATISPQCQFSLTPIVTTGSVNTKQYAQRTLVP
ncbi:hypothetical protein DFH08DRAFT_993459 [Mycena albidolilacea]|uniref:Uncharacterized protein n=1 Tax=Mycena albidolilacea TaxID=1033008 RepID=A0AAD6YY90_9AGAR|nr:hypothetical protein DFH08DRAFT_993459 [Mycena albidolilacea]